MILTRVDAEVVPEVEAIAAAELGRVVEAEPVVEQVGGRAGSEAAVGATSSRQSRRRIASTAPRTGQLDHRRLREHCEPERDECGRAAPAGLR